MNIQKKFDQWFFKSSTLLIIECQQDASQFIWQFVQINKKGEQFDILKKSSSPLSLKNMLEELPKDSPTVFVYNAKGLIHKTVETFEANTNEDLQNIFPKANQEEFFLQRLEFNQFKILSICRKQTIIPQLEHLKNAGLKILQLYLGSFFACDLYPLLTRTESNIYTGSHCLTFDKDKLTHFEQNNHFIPGDNVLGEERLHNSLLSLVGLSLRSFTELSVVQQDTSIIKESREYFFWKKSFNFLFLGALGFFFTLLLSNFLLFSYYQEKDHKLESALIQNEGMWRKKEQLLKKVTEKRQLFGDKQSQSKSKVAFYADQIAASLPSGIQLQELNIFPKIEDKKQRIKDQINYEQNLILVKGYCSTSLYYNNWKRQLSDLPWIKTIEHISYQDINPDLAIFELAIRIKQ